MLAFLVNQLASLDPAVASSSSSSSSSGSSSSSPSSGASEGMTTQAVDDNSIVANRANPIIIDDLFCTKDSNSNLMQGTSAVDKQAIERAVQVVQVVRGLSLNNLEAPSWLAKEYRKIEEEHTTLARPVITQSRTDKLVVQRYIPFSYSLVYIHVFNSHISPLTHNHSHIISLISLSYLPSHLSPHPRRYKLLHPDDELEANALLDGFRLDLVFPKVKFQVELDSPSHRIPARMRFDRIRDAYLSNTYGYEVMRLQLAGRSVDDLVSQIHDRLMDKRELMMDQQIQAM